MLTQIHYIYLLFEAHRVAVPISPRALVLVQVIE